MRRVTTPARVNGAAGVVWASRARPFSVVGFTVRGGRIAAIDILADPARLHRIDVDFPATDGAAEAVFRVEERAPDAAPPADGYVS
jgi:hypothetical protein